MRKKLSSRKFWISIAAFLGSIGVSVAGIATNREVVTVISLICSTLSAAIYAACEAYVDASKISESGISK